MDDLDPEDAATASDPFIAPPPLAGAGVASSANTPPLQSNSRAWVYAGLGADMLLLVSGIGMISSGSSHKGRGGGSYAWSSTLLLVTGFALQLIALGGLAGSARVLFGRPSRTLTTTRKVFVAQVIVVAILSVLEVLSLLMFFSFLGKLSHAPSSEIDSKFPIFSNFANCSWNACCHRTHVRERSYEKLACTPGATGFSKDEASLSKLCANMPHETANASTCIMGDGLEKWRQDLSSCIFREIMSWAWIVFTIVVLELAAVAIYSCRWVTLRDQVHSDNTKAKSQSAPDGGPVMKIQ